jgi:hypothetical protein
MVAASIVSLHLARFDRLRAAGSVEPGDRPGLLFCEVGADCRAAGTDPGTREAFIFIVVGLHENEASADTLVTDILTVAPWFAEAVERWSGVLAPFRTKGEANLIDRTAPARLFDPLAAAPSPRDPVVAFTTIGWDRDGLDMARVQDIGTGTAAVRISMTAVPGLRTQQTFFFPGIIAIDPPTLTFWDDERSMVAWAHRQATHKRQMDRYRETGNADRTSFTRLAALRSVGTWHGADPVARARDHELDPSGASGPASPPPTPDRRMPSSAMRETVGAADSSPFPTGRHRGRPARR